MREPEVALLQELKAVFAVEDGGVLAGGLAVITPYTGIGVDALGGYIGQLMGEAFLGAYEVGLVVSQQSMIFLL